MELTGAQVRQVLEEGANSQYGTVQVSGLRWAYDADAPFDDRVTAVTLEDGTPLDDAVTYRIATNNFMATGGDQFTTLTKGTSTVDTGINLVDTIVRYLSVTARSTRRWRDASPSSEARARTARGRTPRRLQCAQANAQARCLVQESHRHYEAVTPTCGARPALRRDLTSSGADRRGRSTGDGAGHPHPPGLAAA